MKGVGLTIAAIGATFVAFMAILVVGMVAGGDLQSSKLGGVFAAMGLGDLAVLIGVPVVLAIKLKKADVPPGALAAAVVVSVIAGLVLAAFFAFLTLVMFNR